MSQYQSPNPLSTIAAAPSISKSKEKSSGGGQSDFFTAMAEAWGEALDRQANNLVTLSNNLTAGGDSPAEITILSSESMRMGFMSNASHSALTSVGTALETMARKQ